MLISYIQYSVYLHILIQNIKISTVELIHPIKFNKEIIKFFILVKVLIFNVDHIFKGNLNTSRNKWEWQFQQILPVFQSLHDRRLRFPTVWHWRRKWPSGVVLWQCHAPAKQTKKLITLSSSLYDDVLYLILCRK